MPRIRPRHIAWTLAGGACAYLNLPDGVTNAAAGLPGLAGNHAVAEDAVRDLQTDSGLFIAAGYIDLAANLALGFGLVARARAAVVLMHTRGRPDTMQEHARYGADPVGEVIDELAVRMRSATDAGIDPARIICDPGIGFAKRAEHSLAVLGQLERFAILGRPLLVGPSRKSFLTASLGGSAADERIWGTAAAVTAAILAGAHIVRVHDVGEMVQVARTADAIIAARRLW